MGHDSSRELDWYSQFIRDSQFTSPKSGSSAHCCWKSHLGGSHQLCSLPLSWLRMQDSVGWGTLASSSCWPRVWQRDTVLQGRERLVTCMSVAVMWGHPFFFSFIFISWRLITLQYCSGFLPYIDMNQLWIYMCSPSWTALPLPSPSHPSGSSQCTSPEHLSHASNLDWRLFHTW